MNVTINGRCYRVDDWQDVLYVYAQYLRQLVFELV